MSLTINKSEYLEKALLASIMAGEVIMSVYGSKFLVDFKEDKSPLTQADIRSHEVIIQILKDACLPFISEEEALIEYDIRKEWNLFWMIDPLDGTKEFVSRNGDFTVNIALIENRIPVLGVVYAPVPDELFFAEESLGAYKLKAFSKIKKPFSLSEVIQYSIRLPDANTKKEGYTVAASRSHLTNETSVFIDNLRKSEGEINLLSRGSSLKLCMVAEGSVDVYPRFGPTMEWDIAAGHAIVRCAGKDVKNSFTNQSLEYNKKDLVNPYFIAS